MRKRLVSVMMSAAMVSSFVMSAGVLAEETATEEVTTEAAAEEETEPANEITGDASSEDAFVGWGWNDDIKKILDGPFAEAYPEEYKRIVFVNTGGSDYYQSKLDPILEDPSNELYPDMMGLEVDYVQKYVNSDCLLSAEDIGITEDDYSRMYQ